MKFAQLQLHIVCTVILLNLLCLDRSAWDVIYILASCVFVCVLYTPLKVSLNLFIVCATYHFQLVP